MKVVSIARVVSKHTKKCDGCSKDTRRYLEISIREDAYEYHTLIICSECLSKLDIKFPEIKLK